MLTVPLSCQVFTPYLLIMFSSVLFCPHLEVGHLDLLLSVLLHKHFGVQELQYIGTTKDSILYIIANSQGNNSQPTRKQQLAHKETIAHSQGNNNSLTRKQQLTHKETIAHSQRNNSSLTKKQQLTHKETIAHSQGNNSSHTRKQQLADKITIVSPQLNICLSILEFCVYCITLKV